ALVASLRAGWLVRNSPQAARCVAMRLRTDEVSDFPTSIVVARWATTTDVSFTAILDVVPPPTGVGATPDHASERKTRSEPPMTATKGTRGRRDVNLARSSAPAPSQ